MLAALAITVVSVLYDQVTAVWEGGGKDVKRVASQEVLFAQGDLRSWLEQRARNALDEVQRVAPNEVLARPYEQIAEEIIQLHLVPEPRLDQANMTGGVTDERVDVSGDFTRGVWDRFTPTYVDGSRITFRVPFTGPSEVLRLRASTSSFNPPRANIGNGCLIVSRDVPADVLERDRDGVVNSIRQEIAKIDTYLGYSRQDIAASNEQLRVEVRRAAETRRAKVLADRDTEAMLGVPLHRDREAAKTYRVQPVARRQVTPARRAHSQEPFIPEPAITDEDFTSIIGDIINSTRMFERLAVTYAGMHEERLRDQILAMLHTVYGSATAETFSKRGKTDIYLPWQDGGPVFIAECKWWTGPKNFAEHDLPQLLDRYIVWRDSHAAMVLFIRNKDVTAVIAAAEKIIHDHPRYLRDANSIHGAPVFVLHKDGDPDREITLALVTAAIHQ